MSTKTFLKTAVMTLSFSGMSGLVGWLCSSALGPRSDPGLDAGLFISGVTFLLSPFLIFPLVRKTHLLVRAQRDLEYLANTDGLTGVPNRRHFYEAAGAVFNGEPDGATVAAVMLDIDEFKMLNDTHGHAAGDAVLKAVASRLRQRLSTVGEDAAAFGRIGGEEFAVVLAGKSAQEASLIAEELVDAVRGLNIATAGKTLAVTISAGSAVQRLPCNLDAVISQADAALYAAKTSGRDRALAAHDKVAAQDAAGRAAA